MKSKLIILISCLLIVACTPVERAAYNTAVGAKAFLDSVKSAHPECATTPTTTVCQDLTKATAAKDLLIDAIATYCGITPTTNPTQACTPPIKNTPAYTIATNALQSAIANYNQLATDLKGVK